MNLKLIIVGILVLCLVGCGVNNEAPLEEEVVVNESEDLIVVNESEDLTIEDDLCGNDVCDEFESCICEEDCGECIGLPEVEKTIIDAFRKKFINFEDGNGNLKVNKFNDLSDEKYNLYSSSLSLILEIKNEEDYIYDDEAFFEELTALRLSNLKEILLEEKPSREYKHKFDSSLIKRSSGIYSSNIWSEEQEVYDIVYGIEKMTINDPVYGVVIFLKCNPKYIIALNSNNKPPLDTFWKNLEIEEYREQLVRYLNNVANYELGEAKKIQELCLG
ncbi:hypothetical protein KY321_05200 [Candidatus Woesearchaeota archaeon]|nr:hypothetical protein [Candidatus Woesearchaeota archaeon]